MQIDVDNVVLYNKIISIENKRPSRKKLPFELKKNTMVGYRKKEIVTMAQENLYMFKRLKEKTSYYDFGKFDKEYDKAQYYKRSHCSLLPSIDFSKNRRYFSLGNNRRINTNNNYNNSSLVNNIDCSNSNNINK